MDTGSMGNRENLPAESHQPSNPETPLKLRPFGLDKGIFEVGPEFFEPMPDDFLVWFCGEK
jgi:hypothetical protein